MGNLAIQPDFYHAFIRHWHDAEYLYADSRLANADQLYAYSAECGLKCLMERFGMQVDPTSGRPPKKDRIHADQIWDRYESYRVGSVATGYELPATNPFGNWSVNNRYAPDSHFIETDVDVHRSGTEIVKRLINKAILEGRLSI